MTDLLGDRGQPEAAKSAKSMARLTSRAQTRQGAYLPEFKYEGKVPEKWWSPAQLGLL